MLSQDYYRWIGYRGVDGFELDQESRTLVNMPLFHIAAQLFFVQNLLVDGSTVLADSYKPNEFWDQVCEFQINNTFMTGAMAIALERTPSHPLETRHNLKTCVGAQVPVNTQKVFIKRFNWELLECYGSTECGMALIANRETPKKSRAIGVPSRGVEIRLFDENDREVPINTPGEIVIKGSGIMSGYYKNEEATAQAMRGGWFHTGDLAKKDEEGNFYYVDRAKDSIRRSAENIASVEIEDLLNSHPKVLEATVLGVPDELRGQEIMAYIIPKDRESITPQEIVSFCQENLAFFKVPRYIKFVDELPKTITGRVQKFKLGIKDVEEGCFDRQAEKKRLENQ
jgi:crotonobetaine/carnitine-CoA ligase